MASACERIPAGEILWIRLTAPVSTYNAKVGDLVHGVVTQDVMCGDETVVPVGASVLGTVKSVRKVGLGVRHETAALKISFDEIAVTPDKSVAHRGFDSGSRQRPRAGVQRTSCTVFAAPTRCREPLPAA